MYRSQPHRLRPSTVTPRSSGTSKGSAGTRPSSWQARTTPSFHPDGRASRTRSSETTPIDRPVRPDPGVGAGPGAVGMVPPLHSHRYRRAFVAGRKSASIERRRDGRAPGSMPSYRRVSKRTTLEFPAMTDIPRAVEAGGAALETAMAALDGHLAYEETAYHLPILVRGDRHPGDRRGLGDGRVRGLGRESARRLGVRPRSPGGRVGARRPPVHGLHPRRRDPEARILARRRLDPRALPDCRPARPRRRGRRALPGAAGEVHADLPRGTGRARAPGGARPGRARVPARPARLDAVARRPLRRHPGPGRDDVRRSRARRRGAIARVRGRAPRPGDGDRVPGPLGRGGGLRRRAPHARDPNPAHGRVRGRRLDRDRGEGRGPRGHGPPRHPGHGHGDPDPDGLLPRVRGQVDPQGGDVRRVRRRAVAGVRAPPDEGPVRGRGRER